MSVPPDQRRMIRDRYLAVDTSVVADILDDLGHREQGLSSDFVPFSQTQIAGFAYTILGQNVPYSDSGDPKKMEACNGISDNEISVWSGDGSGVCYLGELIALGMASRGSVGALIDGGIRDLRWLREHEFPVFARYRTPVQSIGRWRVTDWNCSVSIRGATTQYVTVRPGDFVLGDEDGVIVIPSDVIEVVLDRAEQVVHTETQIRSALREGATLAECLERFGHV